MAQFSQNLAVHLAHSASGLRDSDRIIGRALIGLHHNGSGTPEQVVSKLSDTDLAGLQFPRPWTDYPRLPTIEWSR